MDKSSRSSGHKRVSMSCGEDSSDVSQPLPGLLQTSVLASSLARPLEELLKAAVTRRFATWRDRAPQSEC